MGQLNTFHNLSELAGGHRNAGEREKTSGTKLVYSAGTGKSRANCKEASSPYSVIGTPHKLITQRIGIYIPAKPLPLWIGLYVLYVHSTTFFGHNCSTAKLRGKVHAL